MYYTVFIHVFFECILFTRSSLTYNIYNSDLSPSNIKVKIDGSIEFANSKEVILPVDLTTENYRLEELSFSASSVQPIKETGIDLIKWMLRESNRLTNKSDKETTVKESKDGKEASKENDYHDVSVPKVSASEKVIEEDLDKKNTRKLESVTEKNDEPSSGAPEASVTQMFIKKHHKVQDDKRIAKFTEHIYHQTLKAFEAMKSKSDAATKQKIDTLAKNYKEKFTDFVLRMRQTDIKTKEGTRNVMLHVMETSNAMMDRIVNFLKTDMAYTDTNLRGGAARLDKEVETVKQLEYQHACKKFGICRNSQGFRTVLQELISILIKLPDAKLIQFNDALTEVLKNLDLSKITETEQTKTTLKKLISSLETMDVNKLRLSLTIVYGALSQFHLPLIMNKAIRFEKPSVKRTVIFHSLINALEEAMPPTEANKQDWATAKERMVRWASNDSMNIQEILQGFLSNSMNGVAKSEGMKDLIENVVKKIESS